MLVKGVNQVKRSRLQQIEVRSGMGWSGLGSDLQHDEEGGVGVLGDDEVCVFVFSVALVAIWLFCGLLCCLHKICNVMMWIKSAASK